MISRRWQFIHKSHGMPQDRGRFTVRQSAGRDFCRDLQVLRRPFPGPSFLEMVCQRRRQVARDRGAVRFQPITAAEMNSCAPGGDLSMIEDFSIEGMRKPIFIRRVRRVADLLAQYILPSRHSVADILEIVELYGRRRGARRHLKSNAEHACGFKCSLLLRTQALDLGFYHLTQRLWHPEMDLLQRNSELPGSILPPNKTPLSQIVHRRHHEQRITLRMTMDQIGQTAGYGFRS